jgi:GNAT superfamily N-acetyltransferase
MGKPVDRDAVVSLIEAMDRHYQSPMPAAGEIGPAVYRWLAGDGTDARIALAFDGDAAVGIAIFAILHPGIALTGLMFVKDIFIFDAARGKVAGEAIMRFLAQYCIESGIGRIDLQTEADNAGARRFYERLGGDLQDAKVAYRFGPDTLEKMVRSAGG